MGASAPTRLRGRSHVTKIMLRISALTGLLALLLAPSAGAAERSSLPSLLARATVPETGAVVAKRVHLRLLNPHAFRVVRRSSASTVTLGWPAQRPCALTTLRLSILPAASDADAATRAVVSVADRRGTSTSQGKLSVDGTRASLTGAWRAMSDITSNRLRVRAVAATPLLTTYGDPVGGLLQLRLDGRTIRGQNRCSGPNVFRLGPNLIDTIITAA
jgi:hypothetical protein